MTINELTTRIQIQHNRELSAFRQDITSAPYQAGTPAALNVARRSVRMQPVQSVGDDSANLTIVADVEGLAWFTADKGLWAVALRSPSPAIGETPERAYPFHWLNAMRGLRPFSEAHGLPTCTGPGLRLKETADSMSPRTGSSSTNAATQSPNRKP